MPEASQSRGYALVEVKPGIVLISFTSTRRSPSMKKSTRAMPAQSVAWKARSASADLLGHVGRQRRRDLERGLPRAVLRVVVVPLAGEGHLAGHRDQRL